jgi:hypothetical protein
MEQPKRRQGFYVVEEYGRPVGTRTPDLYRVKVPRIGFTTTYKTAGTAKVRGSRTRHIFCGLGCGLEIRERNNRLLDRARSFPSRSNVGRMKENLCTTSNYANAATVNPSTSFASPQAHVTRQIA